MEIGRHRVSRTRGNTPSGGFSSAPACVVGPSRATTGSPAAPSGCRLEPEKAEGDGTRGSLSVRRSEAPPTPRIA